MAERFGKGVKKSGAMVEAARPGTTPAITHPNTLQSAERRKYALELRREGWSYEDIALLLEVTTKTAGDYVRQAIQELNADTLELAEDVKYIELQRLDLMLQGCMAGIKAGDIATINAALAITKVRAQLLGLNAPVRADFRGAIATLSPDDVSKMSDAELSQHVMKLVDAATVRKMFPDIPTKALREAVDSDADAEE